MANRAGDLKVNLAVLRALQKQIDALDQALLNHLRAKGL